MQVQKIGFAPPTDTPLLQVGTGQALAGPDLRLTRGGAISGRVLDARGEPMAEVMVMAVRKPTGGSGRGRGAPALPAGQPGQTNDIGEFRISGLPAGDYYVAASPRPMIPLGQSSPSPSPSGSTTLVATYYPGTSTMAGAQVITVAAGQTISSLEFAMLSAVGYSITGVVVDETEQTGRRRDGDVDADAACGAWPARVRPDAARWHVPDQRRDARCLSIERLGARDVLDRWRDRGGWRRWCRRVGQWWHRRQQLLLLVRLADAPGDGRRR